MTKALLQQALSAMKYHTEQTRPIERTYEAMDALKAAIAQPVQPAPQQATQEPVWMPIETTPKDGTAYDIWADGQRYTNMITCSYGGHHPAGGGTFIYRSHRVLRATHWMPLPTAPQQEKTK